MASGKSHLAKILVEDEGYTKLAFATALKEYAEDLFQVTGKDGPAREVYQAFGANMREIDENVWLYPVARQLEWLFTNPDTKVVIDDVRYQNEYNFLEESGFLMVKVEVPKDIRQERIQRLYPSTTLEQQQHISELNLWDKVGVGTITSINGSVYYDLGKYVNWSDHVGATT